MSKANIAITAAVLASLSLLPFVRVQIANSRPHFFFINLFIFHKTLLKLTRSMFPCRFQHIGGCTATDVVRKETQHKTLHFIPFLGC